ncbi:MAG: hypothetical protein ACRCX2_36425 [Paraclostridium sp.]
MNNNDLRLLITGKLDLYKKILKMVDELDAVDAHLAEIQKVRETKLKYIIEDLTLLQANEAVTFTSINHAVHVSDQEPILSENPETETLPTVKEKEVKKDKISLELETYLLGIAANPAKFRYYTLAKLLWKNGLHGADEAVHILEKYNITLKDPKDLRSSFDLIKKRYLAYTEYMKTTKSMSKVSKEHFNNLHELADFTKSFDLKRRDENAK